MNTRLIFFLCPLVLACSAKNPDGEKENKESKRAYLPEKNPVEVMVVQEGTFKEEMVSNGKLSARRKSVLTFDAGGVLAELNYRNGDRVRKGVVIARLRQDQLRQACRQAELDLEKARIDLQDLLIGQGYEPADSASVPPGVMQVARIRSGYLDALHALKNAEANLQGSVLNAPFTGILANLEYKIHEHVPAGKAFCTLLDRQWYRVEFSVLETEISRINLHKPVRIALFSDPGRSFRGEIVEINPVIDENGLVQVAAQTPGAKGLMDGMNVKVYIENNIPGQLVVPRQAVVLRQNQEVLFKYTGGIAYWTYVQVLHENSTNCAVIAHPDKVASLAPGDTVIVSGNLNLAHESPVTIQ